MPAYSSRRTAIGATPSEGYEVDSPAPSIDASAPPVEPSGDFFAADIEMPKFPHPSTRFNAGAISNTGWQRSKSGLIRQQAREDERRETITARAGEAKRREAVRTARANEVAAQKTRNATAEAHLRAAGAKYYKDEFGDIRQEVDADGKPLFREEKFPIEYGPDGKAVQRSRDREGNVTSVDPDANAEIGENRDDPEDRFIYRKNKHRPWDAIDPEEGILSGDARVRIASGRVLHGRQLRSLDAEIRQTSLDLAEASRSGTNAAFNEVKKSPHLREQWQEEVAILSVPTPKPEKKSMWFGNPEKQLAAEMDTWRETEQTRVAALNEVRAKLEAADSYEALLRRNIAAQRAKHSLIEQGVGGFLRERAKSVTPEQIQTTAEDLTRERATMETESAEIEDRAASLNERAKRGMTAAEVPEFQKERADLQARADDLQRRSEEHNERAGNLQRGQDARAAESMRNAALAAGTHRERIEALRADPQMSPLADKLQGLESAFAQRQREVEAMPDWSPATKQAKQRAAEALQADMRAEHGRVYAAHAKEIRGKAMEEAQKTTELRGAAEALIALEDKAAGISPSKHIAHVSPHAGTYGAKQMAAQEAKDAAAQLAASPPDPEVKQAADNLREDRRRESEAWKTGEGYVVLTDGNISINPTAFRPEWDRGDVAGWRDQLAAAEEAGDITAAQRKQLEHVHEANEKAARDVAISEVLFNDNFRKWAKANHPELGDIDDAKLDDWEKLKEVAGEFLDSKPSAWEWVRDKVGRFYEGAIQRTGADLATTAGVLSNSMFGWITGQDIDDNFFYQLGQAANYRLTEQADPRMNEAFTAHVASGMGSTVAFMIPGMAVSKAMMAANYSPKAIRVVTGAVVAGQGAIMEGAQQYHEARAYGLEHGDALLPFVLGGLVGTSEVVPINRWISRLGKQEASKAWKIIGNMLVEAIEEATQESFQSISGNIIAQNIYDKHRETFDGLGEAAGVGATVGAIMSLLISGVTNARIRMRKSPNRPQTPGTEGQGPAQPIEIPGFDPVNGKFAYSTNDTTEVLTAKLARIREAVAEVKDNDRALALEVASQDIESILTEKRIEAAKEEVFGGKHSRFNTASDFLASQSDKHAAMGAVKLAAGRPFDSLSAEEQSALKTKLPNGRSRVEVVHGRDVITDAQLEHMGQTFPVARRAIQMDQSQATEWAARKQKEDEGWKRSKNQSNSTATVRETVEKWTARGRNGTEVSIPASEAATQEAAEDRLAALLPEGEMLDIDSVRSPENVDKKSTSPESPHDQQQGSAAVEHLTHNQEVAGSTPAPATTAQAPSGSRGAAPSPVTNRQRWADSPPSKRAVILAKVLANKGISKKAAEAFARQWDERNDGEMPLDQAREGILAAFREAGGIVPGEAAEANYNTDPKFWVDAGYSQADAVEFAKAARENQSVDADRAAEANNALAERILEEQITADDAVAEKVGRDRGKEGDRQDQAGAGESAEIQPGKPGHSGASAERAASRGTETPAPDARVPASAKDRDSALRRERVRITATDAPSMVRADDDGTLHLNLSPTNGEKESRAYIEHAHDEELRHTFALLALRRQWEADGKTGGFNEWIKEHAVKTFSDLQERLGKLKKRSERRDIERAMVASFNLYWGDLRDKSPGVRTVEDIAAALDAGSFGARAADYTQFIHEFARQIRQLQEGGKITEETLRDFLAAIIRWVRDAVRELKVFSAAIKSKDHPLFHSQLARLIRQMESEERQMLGGASVLSVDERQELDALRQMRDERRALEAKRRAARQQRQEQASALAGEFPEGSTGSTTYVLGANKRQIPAVYVAVPDDRVVASHDGNTFAKNPDYPGENTRAYDDPASGEAEKVARNAADYLPDLDLSNTPSSDSGPPIIARVIREDGASVLAVVGGNSRRMMRDRLDASQRSALDDATAEAAVGLGIEREVAPGTGIYRFIGSFDFRQEGQREAFQQAVADTNAQETKAQGQGREAQIAAATTIPPSELAGIPFHPEPAAAQQWIAERIASGALNANKLDHLTRPGAESEAQAFVDRLMASAALRSPALESWVFSAEARKQPAFAGLVEQAIPAAVAMRSVDGDTAADAISRVLANTVENLQRGKSKTLPAALKQAAQQTEMGEGMETARLLAIALSDAVVTNKRGAIDPEASVEKFADLFRVITSGVTLLDGEPDLLGDVRTVDTIIRDAIGAPQTTLNARRSQKSDAQRIRFLMKQAETKGRLTPLEAWELETLERRAGQQFMPFATEPQFALEGEPETDAPAQDPRPPDAAQMALFARRSGLPMADNLQAQVIEFDRRARAAGFPGLNAVPADTVLAWGAAWRAANPWPRERQEAIAKRSSKPRRKAAVAVLKARQSQERLDEISATFRDDLLRAEFGHKTSQPALQLGQASPALQLAGVPDGPIYMKVATALAKPDDPKHAFPRFRLRGLPALLHRPILVHESWTVPNALVALLDVQHKGKSFVAALHMKQTAQGVEITEVASFYPRDSKQIREAFERTIAQRSGRITYWDKEKTRVWLSQQSGFNSPQYWVQQLGAIQGLPSSDLLVNTLQARRSNATAEPDLFSFAAENYANTVKVEGVTAPDLMAVAAKKDLGATAPAMQQLGFFEPATAELAARAIEDFGQKIGGARKDRAQAFAKATDSDIEKLPLSKVWPKSQVDEIEDIPLAALAHTLRESIQAKPRNPGKVRRWADQVRTVRTLIDAANERGFEFVMGKLRERQGGLPSLAIKIDLLQSIPREAWGRVGTTHAYPNAYRYEQDAEGKTVPDPATGRAKQIPSPVFTVRLDDTNTLRGTTPEALMAKLKDAVASQPVAPGKKMQWEVRDGRDGKIHINKKGDPLYRVLKEFDDAKDAFAFIKNNYDDLVAAWEDVKASDNVRETDVRGEENRPRSGQDWRQGRDVTPEMFMDAFRFKGVEFGNWVSDGRNDKERQGMLNAAYDALHDLAAILNIPTQAVSLNGDLGLGFGSRGHGRFSAHYEPDFLVINLTKTRGAGTLAHEWFHALDHYFQRKRNPSGVSNGEGDFITQQPEDYYTDGRYRVSASRFKELATRTGWKGGDWKLVPGVRVEVSKAFADLVRALDASPMAKRARLNDKGKSGYWGSVIERAARAFENYIIGKMTLGGYHNDYLANVLPVESFSRNPNRYPYLLPEELAPVSEAFDALFGTMKTEPTDKGMALYARGSNTTPTFYSQMQAVLDAKMPNAAPPAQVRAIIDPANGSGIKPEELKWSGINQAIDALAVKNGGKVPKADLLNYLRDDGAVRIEEINFQGMSATAPLRFETHGDLTIGRSQDGHERHFIQKLPNGKFSIKNDSRGLGVYNSLEEAQAQANEYWLNRNPATSQTKFESWTLPGGENYREVVLAMPLDPEAVHAEADRSGSSHRTAQARLSYTSSHFPDVPNYVAHMRLNERTDAEGKPGLFIEEIQSDRHQAGREKGYKEGLKQENFVVWGTREYGLSEDAAKKLFNTDSPIFKEYQEAQSEALKDAARIPDAPFRTTWPLQMFKRALRDAVASGKDWIGWTTGLTQIDRYTDSLRQRVRSIEWSTENGLTIVDVKPSDGKRIYLPVKDGKIYRTADQPDFVGKPLAEVIGKEHAAKIAEAPEGKLEGKDLTIGGEGMKGFYDTILPKEIGKYVKQWGGSVIRDKMTVEGQNEFGESIDPSVTPDVAVPFWKVEITHPMREGVATRGQPFFARTSETVPGDLVRDNMGLATTIANDYRNIPGVDLGDVIQHARMALVRAAKQFDPAKATSFANYAGRAIRNELNSLYGKQMRAAAHEGPSMDEPLADDEAGTRHDVTPDESGDSAMPVERQETAEIIEEIISALPGRPQAIIRGYMDGRNGEDMARELGITRQAVNATLRGALSVLKKKLAARGMEGHEEGILFARQSDSLQGMAAELEKDLPSQEEIDALREKAAAEPEGKRTVGQPRKANYAADKATRREIDVVQDMREHSRKREEERAWIIEARQRLKTDRDAAKRTILEKALNPSKFGTLTAVDVKTAQILVPQLIREAFRSGDKAKQREAFALAWAYDAGGSDQARAFAARRDPFKTPAERHAEFLAKMVSTPTAAQRKWIDKAPNAEEKSRRLEQAQNERLAKIEKALADMGVTLEDIFAGEASVVLKGAPLVQNALRSFTKKEERDVIRMTLDGFSDKDISKKTGLAAKDIQGLQDRMDELLAARLGEFADRGFTAEDLETMDVAKLFARADAPQVRKVSLTAEQKAQIVAEMLRKIRPDRNRRNSGRLVRRRRVRPPATPPPAGPIPSDAPVPYEKFRREQDMYESTQPWEFVAFDIGNREQSIRAARTIQAADGNGFDMFYEAWVNSILSGPQTQGVNIIGNSLMAGWEYAMQRPLEAAMNLVLNEADVTTFDELKRAYRAILPGVMEGWAAGIRAFRMEMDFFEGDKINQQVEFADFDKGGGYVPSIGGLKGRIIRIPGRALMFMDSFFKHLTGRMEVGAQAYRLGRAQKLSGQALEDFIKREVNTPGSMSWQRAVAQAKYLTFQTEMPEKAKGLTKLRSTRNYSSFGGRLMGVFLGMHFPFIRTPYNIFRIGLRKSPVGAVNVVNHITQGLYSIKAGRPFVEGYSKAQMVKDLAEQTIAWTATLLLLGAVEGDDDDDDKWLLITGSRPQGVNRQGERDALNRTSGGPYIIRIGGRNGIYINYGRLDPLAITLGTIADGVRAGKTTGSHGFVDQLISSLIAQTEDKTFLQGWGAITDALDSAKTGGATGFMTQYVQRQFLTGLVPNIFRQPIRNLDDAVRDSRHAGLGYRLTAAPGLAEQRYDLYGNPMTKLGNKVSRLAINTGLQPTPTLEPGDRMLQQWNARHPDESYWPERPNRNFYRLTTREGDEEMTSAQVAETDRLAGETFKRKLRAWLTPAKANNPSESDLDRFKNDLRDSRREAREAVTRRARLTRPAVSP